MSMKVLVAYASKAGSTREVAESIGKVLVECGAAVDVHPVQKVKDLAGYQAVVLGSAVRMGRILPEALRFAKKRTKELAEMPTAYFTVSLTMKEDTPENRAKAALALDPLRRIREPIRLRLFAGKLDVNTLGPVWRFMISRIKDSSMGIGDFRNWDAIRAWAEDLATEMQLIGHRN